jgi:Transcriptional regulator, AbiEi antitoxin
VSANDAEGAVAELAASQHGAFSGRQAAERGLTRRELDRLVERGLVARRRPAVFVMTGAPRTWSQDLMVATVAGNGAVASHRAAARLHGLKGFDKAPVEVTVVRGRYPAADGIIVHRAKMLSDEDVIDVDGIRSTTLARLVADLGAVCREDKVEQTLDDILRRDVSLAWIAETLRRVERPGPSGTATLRHILGQPDRLGRLPDSWLERLIERLLAEHGLPPPVRQYRVSASGRIIARLDFAWPELRFGVGPMGAEWHAALRRWRIDRRQANRLVGAGWTVLTPTWEDHLDPTEFLFEASATYRRCSRSSAS